MRSFYFPVYPGCILVSGSQSKGFLCACSSRWEDGLGREALQEDPPGRERPVPHLDEPAAGQEAQGQAARQEGRQVQEQEGHGLVTGTDPKDIGSASTCWDYSPGMMCLGVPTRMDMWMIILFKAENTFLFMLSSSEMFKDPVITRTCQTKQMFPGGHCKLLYTLVGIHSLKWTLYLL